VRKGVLDVLCRKNTAIGRIARLPLSVMFWLEMLLGGKHEEWQFIRCPKCWRANAEDYFKIA
jgi:hypothetical protein